MNDLAKSVIKIVGLVFGALVIGFTGFQTYSLLFDVSGNYTTAAIGLTLFEGGMLYWWFVFQKHAEGIFQMAISILMAVFGLVLVIMSTSLHLGAVEMDLLGANTPAKVVVVAAVVNLVGKFLFPLFDPETFNQIWRRALEGKISLKAFRDAESKVDDMAGQLADKIGREISRRLEVQMLTHFGLEHGYGAELPPEPPKLKAGDNVVRNRYGLVDWDGHSIPFVLRFFASVSALVDTLDASDNKKLFGVDFQDGEIVAGRAPSNWREYWDYAFGGRPAVVTPNGSGADPK